MRRLSNLLRNQTVAWTPLKNVHVGTQVHVQDQAF